MIVNEQSLASLAQAVNMKFLAGLGRAVTPMDTVAMEIPSMTAENVYPYLLELGQIREWLGDREIQNIAKGEFRIANKDFEETHGVPRNAIDDDTYGVYGPIFEQVGRNVAAFPSDQVYAVLKAGGTTLGPDGQYFFDNDHPVGDGIVSNDMGGAGEAWYLVDSSKVFKPIIYQPRKSFDLVKLFNPTDPNVFLQKQYLFGVDGRAGFGFSPFWQLAFRSRQTLDSVNLRAALTAMSAQKGPNGKPLKIDATHLIVSPNLFEAANDLVNKQLTNGGESNTLYQRLKVQKTPELL